MDAIDEKYALAVSAMRRESRRRGITFKELIVRMASEKNLINIPLWNADFDARLIASSQRKQVVRGNPHA